jgi:hypothetical protein
MFQRTRLAFMGLGTLPRVGPHPGLPMLAGLVAIAMVSCAPKGLAPMLAVGPFLLVCLGPLVLYGALGRARQFLAHERAQAKDLLQAYTDVFFPEGKSIRWCLMPMPHNGLWVENHHGKKLHLFIDNHVADPALLDGLEHLRGLVEQALSPRGFFEIPKSMGMVLCKAKPFPSAHAKMQAMARVSQPPTLPKGPNGPT